MPVRFAARFVQGLRVIPDPWLAALLVAAIVAVVTALIVLCVRWRAESRREREAQQPAPAGPRPVPPGRLVASWRAAGRHTPGTAPGRSVTITGSAGQLRGRSGMHSRDTWT